MIRHNAAVSFRALLAALALVPASSIAVSQGASPVESGVAAAAPACATVVRVGSLVDPLAGKVRRSQAIRIGGGRVLAVLDDGPAALAGCAQTVDLRDRTVLPGLIDTHTHLTSDPTILRYARLGLSIPRLALIGAANARRTLQAGFTTVRNVGADGYADIALRDAIDLGEG